MLLNMVMFKVTICDIGKMNINMTDKIEKKRQPLQCRTMARTTTIMSMVRSSAAIAVVTSPTLKARWYSILSMYHCMKPCYRHLKLGGFTIGEYRPI